MNPDSRHFKNLFQRLVDFAWISHQKKKKKKKILIPESKCHNKWPKISNSEITRSSLGEEKRFVAIYWSLIGRYILLVVKLWNKCVRFQPFSDESFPCRSVSSQRLNNLSRFNHPQLWRMIVRVIVKEDSVWRLNVPHSLVAWFAVNWQAE
jgi:hypothetical protein